MPSLTSVELDTNRILVNQAKTFLRRGLFPGIGLLKAVNNVGRQILAA